MTEHQQALDAFIRRAGHSWGWENLESAARNMAEQAIEEIPAWQPIETAPKDGTEILAYGKLWAPRGWSTHRPEVDEDHPTAYGFDVIIIYWESDRWQTGKLAGFTPTHWQPKPAPPGA